MNKINFQNTPSTATAISAENLNQMQTNIENAIKAIYPVGAVYISVNSTNPSTLFGGTWEQIKDRFLLSSGDTYSAGATGGNATHNHTLNSGYAKITRTFGTDSVFSKEKTINEAYQSTVGDGAGRLIGTADSYQGTSNKAVELGGNTDTANNMPPYLTVYMWKRTA